MKKATAAITLIASALACTSADAQQMTMVVGFSPGATYDIYTRTFARHLGKHLPGKPNVVVQNMTGAGSLRSANFIYNAAPKDGTTIGMFARGLAMQPLLDMTGIQYEARKFNWIGSMSSDVSLVLSWHTRPFKTIDDLRKSEMVVAGTGSGRRQRHLPLHPQRRAGHQDEGRDRLSRRRRLPAGGRAPGGRRHRRRLVERILTPARPEWIAKKQINVIVQLGLKRHPEHESRAAGDGFRQERFRPRRAGADLRPAGYGLSDRGAARHAAGARGGASPCLRSRDARTPNFSPMPKSSTLKPQFMRGEEIEKLIKRIFASPPDVIARAVRRSRPARA